MTKCNVFCRVSIVSLDKHVPCLVRRTKREKLFPFKRCIYSSCVSQKPECELGADAVRAFGSGAHAGAEPGALLWVVCDCSLERWNPHEVSSHHHYSAARSQEGASEQHQNHEVRSSALLLSWLDTQEEMGMSRQLPKRPKREKNLVKAHTGSAKKLTCAPLDLP